MKTDMLLNKTSMQILNTLQAHVLHILIEECFRQSGDVTSSNNKIIRYITSPNKPQNSQSKHHHKPWVTFTKEFATLYCKQFHHNYL